MPGHQPAGTGGDQGDDAGARWRGSPWLGGSTWRVPVFFGLPAAAACYGWRAGEPHGFAVYRAATAVAMPVTSALAGADFGQSSRLGRYGGLFQRASIITGFAWLTTVSVRALQRTPPGTARTS